MNYVGEKIANVLEVIGTAIIVLLAGSILFVAFTWRWLIVITLLIVVLHFSIKNW
jgi:hypothetical protein